MRSEPLYFTPKQTVEDKRRRALEAIEAVLIEHDVDVDIESLAEDILDALKSGI